MTTDQRQYRGLTKEGKWVYGWYAKRCVDTIDNLQDVIIDAESLFSCEVIPETVGQSTGPKDKKRTKEFPEGQEIFGGDIVTMGHPKLIALIKYEHCGFVMEHCRGSKRREYCDNGKSEPIFKNCNISLEVIGNISQHPHLFKG